MSAPITLVCGDRDLSASYSDLTFSNTDPGGFEALQATSSDAGGVAVGDEVIVRCGLDVAWHGRVNELGRREGGRRSTTQIAAVGYGAKLTDGRMSMIYIDRDLSRWGPISNPYKVAGAATYAIFDPTVAPDTGGDPNLWTAISGGQGSILPWCTAMYDAGDGNTIASVFYVWSRLNINAADANYTWDVVLGTTSTFAAADTSGNLRAAGPATGTLTASTGTRRYALLEWYYAVAGPWALPYGILWNSNLSVYGPHGLTKHGADPGGFYPGDIAGHAATLSGAGFDTVIGDSSTLIVRNSVYRDPVKHDQPIADMAKLMGWHWGVWEPGSVLSSTPRLFFTAPPAAPTAICARDRIADLDAPKVRADLLYDTAKVSWQDPAGQHGVQTCTLSNPLAAAAGVSGRTLDLDMGRGDATAATTYGGFALALALAGARGGGSGTVPDMIILTGGGRAPACLLRSGRDRIRITDLPDAGSITASDADRQDSFLVRRVETSVKGGAPSTRIEFDGGADLLEVLGARLALAQAGT
jgi:hypothetical protein